MPVVWSDRCLLHQPLAEIWAGMRTPAAEMPSRVEAIRAAIDARIVEAEPHPDEALLAVNVEALLAFLASAWEEWQRAELEQDQVVPYVTGHEAACILAG